MAAAFAEERKKLLDRISELEAVLDATADYLNARRTRLPGGQIDTQKWRHAAATPSASDGNRSRSRRFAFGASVVVMIVITLAAAGVLLTRRSAADARNSRSAAPTTASSNADASPREAGSTPTPPVATQNRPDAINVGPSAPISLNPSAPANAKDLTIELKASPECWIGATLDRERRVERLLKARDLTTLHARDEIVLRLGNPGAVSVVINGLAAKSFGIRGQPATIRITRANYRQFVTENTP